MELLEQLKTLLEELEGKNTINKEQTDRMFNLNNTIFPNVKEHGRTCVTCRSRVYNRLKNYYAAITPSSN
jgi:hypothetical protein